MSTAAKPTPHQIITIASKAHADERTVRRRLKGLPVRPSIAERIDASMRELGLERFTPSAPDAAQASSAAA